MPKTTHSVRLSDRTWSQLKKLADWLQVDDRTKVIEILAEREAVKMELNSDKAIDKWLQEKYPIDGKVQLEHPGGNGPQEATVISHITENIAHPTLADGVRVQFNDGVFIDVPAGHLGRR